MHEALLAPARALLGAEVAWGNAAVTALVALGLSLGLALVAVLGVMPRSLRQDAAGLPWPERARLAWPMRQVATQLAVILPGLGALLGWSLAGPLGALSPAAMAALGAVSAAVPVWSLRAVIERMLRSPEVAAWRGLRSTVTLHLLLLPHLWAALALAVAMPERFDTLGWMRGLALALGLLGFLWAATGGGLWVARGLGLVRSDGRLDAVLARVAVDGQAPPRGYVAALGMANALAFPWRRSVVVTAPAMALLNDDPLVAVCAHEVAHLTEGPRVRALRLAAMVLLATPVVCARPVLAGYGVVAFDLLVLGCVLGIVVLRRGAHAMELRADAAGHAREVSPGDYAAALEALYRGNLMPVVTAGRRKVHPDLYDRMEAAGVVPSYPRPLPPKRWPTVAAVLGAVLCGTGLWVALRWGVGQATGGADEDRVRAVMMTGGAGRSLGDLAWRRYQDGKVDEAVTLYRAALVAEPTLSWNAANLTIVLANAGRCSEAGEAWRVVQARSRPGGAPVRIEAEARRALVDCAAPRAPRRPGGMWAI